MTTHLGTAPMKGEGADVGAYPVGKRLAPGCLGIGVVAGSHDRHKHLGIPDLAGCGIDYRQSLAAVVHEHLLSSPVLLAHGEIELFLPLAEEIAELAVLIAVGIVPLVLLPQQHERQVLVGNQFSRAENSSRAGHGKVCRRGCGSGYRRFQGLHHPCIGRGQDSLAAKARQRVSVTVVLPTPQLLAMNSCSGRMTRQGEVSLVSFAW